MSIQRRNLPWGYRWRSSQTFIIVTATISLFSETFLFGFIVPILPYMLEVRLNIDPSRTQRFTTTLLTVYGLVSLVAAPFIAHFADKTPSRKYPLLGSLALCTVGTLFVACAPSVWFLMSGLVLQSLSSSAAWIVAFATLADNLSPEHKGRVVGSVMSLVGTGIFAGPMVSGALLQLFGYWPAWVAAIVLLAVDFVTRLIMIEGSSEGSHSKSSSSSSSSSTIVQSEEEEETTDLLPPTGTQPTYDSVNTDSNSNPSKPLPGHHSASEPLAPSGFYKIMFTNPQILAGLINTLATSIIMTSFDATLPLHLREIFNWGSLPVGMTFLGLQAPSILLGPLMGWLRDRIGLRYPTTIGWGLLVPLLWLVAVPGKGEDAGFPWARPAKEGMGEAVFVIAIIGIGMAFAFIRGAGSFQLIAVVSDLQTKNPAIFGPYGGNSRLSGLTEISFNLGMMLGPLVSGTLSELAGYYYMSCTLAGIALLVTFSSFLYLSASPKGEDSDSHTV